jgi:hypothetical protein
MSVPHKSLLLALSLTATVAFASFTEVRDAGAQPSAPLTPYPTCTTKPTAQDSEAARSAYLLGKRFFDESDYGSASHNFIDAYKLDCSKPELLLNVARANEAMGNRAEAIHALETYMQRSQTLSVDEKAQLQRRIDNLKAAMAAQAAPAPAVPAVLPPSPPPAPVPTPATPAPAPPPASGSADTSAHHTVAPWVVTGVGGAAVVAGGLMYLVGAVNVSSAENSCTSTHCSQATANQGTSADSLEKAGAAVFYSGLVVAAGGLLWHFLEPTSSSAPRKTSLSPEVGPGFAGASVVGTF